MFKRKLTPFLAAMVLSSLGATANANVIYLSPFVQSVSPGDLVSFDLSMSFLGDTIGGALDVFYTPDTLGFVSFEFNPDFLGPVADPDLSVFPTDCSVGPAPFGGCSAGDPELNGIGFGHFDGISGDHIIGTLTFMALAPGAGVITMATNDEPWGSAFFNTLGNEMVVHYSPAKVEVVPIPAAVWLFASGIGLFAGFARRRRG